MIVSAADQKIGAPVGHLGQLSERRSFLPAVARALRAWSVPLVLPVPRSWQSFGPDGHLADDAIAARLRALGAEVVRAARQFQAEGTCDYAEDRQFAPGGSAPEPRAGRPAT